MQTGDEELQPLARRELVLVAVVGDGDAADQFHHEVGPAALGGAGVEHAGDVGMVHQGQRLPLGLEAGDHVAGVHARLDDLEGHLAADGLLLLGDEDQAKAPFADLLHQLVGADGRADLLADRFAELRRSQGGSQLVERSVRLAVGAEQVFDPLPESRIASARPLEKRSPLGRVLDVERGKENAFGIFGRVRHRRALCGHRLSTQFLPGHPKIRN